MFFYLDLFYDLPTFKAKQVLHWYFIGTVWTFFIRRLFLLGRPKQGPKQQFVGATLQLLELKKWKKLVFGRRVFARFLESTLKKIGRKQDLLQASFMYLFVLEIKKNMFFAYNSFPMWWIFKILISLESWHFYAFLI